SERRRNIMASTDYRIGFVGVGRMGANMARRLTDVGYSVVAAYDADHAKTEQLAKELGCEAAGTPARVAELADTVFTVITDDHAMRQIYARDRTDSLLAH